MVAKSRTSRSFRDIVACLELSVHWVPSVLICFDCFALDFEVEAMWFFQLDYMNGWLLNLLMCIDIGLQKPSKYCTLRSDLMRLDVDLAFFRQGHNNWNTESRRLGSQMRFDNDIRIHQDFEVFRRHLTREVNTYCSARVKLWFALVNRQGAQLETQKMKKFQLHLLIAVECFGMYWEGWEGWTEADHCVLVTYCQWPFLNSRGSECMFKVWQFDNLAHYEKLRTVWSKMFAAYCCTPPSSIVNGSIPITNPSCQRILATPRTCHGGGNAILVLCLSVREPSTAELADRRHERGGLSSCNRPFGQVAIALTLGPVRWFACLVAR